MRRVVMFYSVRTLAVCLLVGAQGVVEQSGVGGSSAVLLATILQYKEAGNQVTRFRRITPARLTLLLVLVLIGRRAAFWTSQRSVQPGASISQRSVSVAYVIDGDTFETTSGERVRLLGVDAPEIAHGKQPAERYAEEARKWLASRIQGQAVTLNQGGEAEDRYGRTLAWVYAGDGGFVNQELLKSGHARILDSFGLPLSVDETLRTAEAEARIQKCGVWQ